MEIARIARLRAQGRSWPQIPDELGVASAQRTASVSRFQKTLPLTPSLRVDSARLTAAHLPFKKQMFLERGRREERYHSTVSPDAMAKAKQFAETAYKAVLETTTREFARKSGELRNRLAARGSILSGQMSRESAGLYGEQIKTLVQARLDALIEGYELHGVPIDEQLSASIIDDVSRLQSSLLAQTEAVVRASPVERGPIDVAQFIQLVQQETGGSLNSIRTQIERKRPMRKPEAANVTNVYHVYGHNPRWNVNSTDQSVNVVTASNDQIFAELRQQLTASVPAGDELNDILEKLTALEAAQNSSSFAHRYTDFVSAAANHMTLLAPFIPALAEMLSKALS